jgi:hypothetical protein
VQEAKQEMLWSQVSNTWEEASDTPVEENIGTEEITQEKKDEPTSIITSLTSWTPLIEIEDLSNKDFYSGEFYINWKTLWQVDKIEVSFSNDTSSYPPDLYPLKQFKSWDATFKYMASSNFKTLDFWLNKYIFTAYSGNSTYKIKVEINIPEKEKTSSNSTDKINAKLSSNWELSTMWDNLEINNLSIKKDFTTEVNCENLTDFLVENYWYSYWNSCRDITKDKSIWFYVLRLKWDNYFYEKHYINYETKQYWILLLETWTWVTKDTIKDKNDELKQVSWDQVLNADKKFK